MSYFIDANGNKKKVEMVKSVQVEVEGANVVANPEGEATEHLEKLQVDDTIFDVPTPDDLDAKVDKVTGKGLSANDFTDYYKNKLSGIESGANVNVQADWNESDNTKDDYIKNKPNLYKHRINAQFSFTASGNNKVYSGSFLVEILSTDNTQMTKDAFYDYLTANGTELIASAICRQKDSNLQLEESYMMITISAYHGDFRIYGVKFDEDAGENIDVSKSAMYTFSDTVKTIF